MRHRSSKSRTKQPRNRLWLTIVALAGPILGYGASISRDQVKAIFDRLVGAHLTVMNSDIKPGSFVAIGSYQYEGKLTIVNKGPAAGHQMRFAVVAPEGCRLGVAQIETWPTTSAPHMHPDHLPFPTVLKMDSEVWSISMWRKHEVLVIHYPLTCFHPLEEDKRLSIDKFSDTTRAGISRRLPPRRAVRATMFHQPSQLLVKRKLWSGIADLE